MIKKIFSILDAHQKSRMLVLLVMIIGGALFETFGVSAILPLVSAVTDPGIIEKNEKYKMAYDLLKAPSYKHFILYMALILVFIYVVKNVYLILLNIAQNHFITNNQRRIAVRLMKCYMRQNYQFHVEHSVAELQRNVETDVSNFITVITSVLQLSTEALVCMMLATYLLITDFYTTILMIVLLVAFLLLFAKVVRKRLRRLGEQTRDLSQAKTKTFLEAFGGIKEIKAISKEDFFINKFDKIYKNFASAAQGQMLLTYIPKPIMESLCISGLLLFMSIRIAMGADVDKFIPVMSVFAIAAIRMLPSFNRISGYLGSLMFNKPAIDAVYEDLKEMELLNKSLTDRKEYIQINTDNIVINNLTFAYPSKPDKKVLDSINMVIPKNKSVALVGPSGAGKTTLADIILGVLKPLFGEVTVREVNVLDYIESWHEHIGYIPQSIFLTDSSIRENVAFGVPEEEIDDEKVWKALEEAQIADFVRDQKDGIYSNIGDRGVKISGGQRQRIGIARALYSNPDIIVLDEATSALDNDTEKAVMEAIYNLSGKKTMIIIAHRISTISKCDIIYEVKNGKVCEKKYEDIIS
ncbi:MAG: ABC transporter ATP-binding protein/permease [Butyrivibrio sp.]|nr:ABC transporter ATP-binding protein/permease [Butyrivibrio sp.]